MSASSAPAAHDDLVGALVTLDLPGDSPLRDLPWIITFGPLNDEDEWEPAVCGPYERTHALGLAEAVVADEELMAVVEPLLPRLSVEEIRADLAEARAALDQPAASAEEPEAGRSHPPGPPDAQPPGPPSPDEVRAGFARIAALLTARS
jgi:hypothetical protein